MSEEEQNMEHTMMEEEIQNVNINCLEKQLNNAITQCTKTKTPIQVEHFGQMDNFINDQSMILIWYIIITCAIIVIAIYFLKQ